MSAAADFRFPLDEEMKCQGCRVTLDGPNSYTDHQCPAAPFVHYVRQAADDKQKWLHQWCGKPKTLGTADWFAAVYYKSLSLLVLPHRALSQMSVEEIIRLYGGLSSREHQRDLVRDMVELHAQSGQFVPTPELPEPYATFFAQMR